MNKTLTLLLLLLLTPSLLYSQEMQVVHGTYLSADNATVEVVPDDGVRIFAEGLKPETKSIVKLVSDYNSGWVILYKEGNPQPTFLLLSPEVIMEEAGTYDVAVLPIVDGIAQPPFYLNDIVVGGDSTVDPVNPVDPPDNEALFELTIQLLNEVNDPIRTSNYLGALKQAEFPSSLALAKRMIGDIRLNTFVGRIEAPWYKFFQPLDEKLAEATTVDEYEGMWKTIISAMAQWSDSTPLSNQTINSTQPQFPANPVENQIFGNYQYQRFCLPDGTCFNAWRELK